MTTAQLLTAIDTIISGIETDRFTIENLIALQKRILAEGIKESK